MIIEGYQVGEPIARGGFAQVFSGTQNSNGRPVALKVLDRIGEREEQRFAREFASLQKLSHDPNIVDVLEIKRTEDGSACIVLEYMPGGSIETLVEANPSGFSEADVAYIADRLLSALGEAHDHGIIHRDVKPSNILLGNGAVKLSDFGIAKFTESSGTTSAAISTTVLYGAPEVLMNRGATEKSDLYSLGSTLFTMLTGRPVHSSVPSALAAAATGKMPELELPGVSEPLTRWLQRMMASDASDRFSSTQDARRALADLVPSEPEAQLNQVMGASANTGSFGGATQTVTVPTGPETSTIMYDKRGNDPAPQWPLRYVAGGVAVLILSIAACSWFLLLRPDAEEIAVATSSGTSDVAEATAPLPTIDPEPPVTFISTSSSLESETSATTSRPSNERSTSETTDTTTGTTTSSSPPPPDNDGDKVANSVDNCPDTAPGSSVDSSGCSTLQLDPDGDDVPTAHPDDCPSTPPGEEVDSGGCTIFERDDDNDGSPVAEDCDDDDPRRSPNFIEVIGNPIDEDCDGIEQTLCKTQLVTSRKITEMQVWAEKKIGNADGNFGGNRSRVTARVESSWDDQTLSLRLYMEARGDENGENSAGWGKTDFLPFFDVPSNQRIVSATTADGISIRKSGAAAVVVTTDKGHHGAEFLFADGLVSEWRVVSDTSGQDVHGKGGDDWANVKATLRAIDFLIETRTEDCVPN